jgi:hypothetical protein
MKTLWMFDVDETLEISSGPVLLKDLVALRNQGDILGLCGNWAHVCRSILNWYDLFSIVGQIAVPKVVHLQQCKMYIPADRFVFVGNDHSRPRAGGYGSPNDALTAAQAGWDFINETDFAAGAR